MVFEQLTEKDVSKRHFVVCTRRPFGQSHRKNGENPANPQLDKLAPYPSFNVIMLGKQTRWILLS
jgi:hypothetical protein